MYKGCQKEIAIFASGNGGKMANKEREILEFYFHFEQSWLLSRQLQVLGDIWGYIMMEKILWIFNICALFIYLFFCNKMWIYNQVDILTQTAQKYERNKPLIIKYFPVKKLSLGRVKEKICFSSPPAPFFEDSYISFLFCKLSSITYF